MTAISEAVILMAGEGSRLRGSDDTFLKPFVQLLGRPLISYVLDALGRAGIKTVNFVVGYESGRMIEQAGQLIPAGLSVSFIENRDWQKQNGISLLAAADCVSRPFFLTMSDHLFDGALVGRLLDSFEPGFLSIAVDRKLDSIFDLEDAMKVQTRGNRIARCCNMQRDRCRNACRARPLKEAHHAIPQPTARNYDRGSRVTISPRALVPLITANALRTRLAPATVTQR